MADLEGLSAEEMEKLLQFQDLTGIEDIHECKNILETHSWDLEVAVQDTLNVREGRPSVYQENRPSSNRNRRFSTDNDTNNQVVQFIPPRLPGQSLLSYIVSIVYNVVTQSVWSFFSIFSRFLRDDPRKSKEDKINLNEDSDDDDDEDFVDDEENCDEMSEEEESNETDSEMFSENESDEDSDFITPRFNLYQSAELNLPYNCELSNGGEARTEPVEDVEAFIENFNDRYTEGVEIRPAFWRSSYSQALAAAKQELKFLLIYLHCQDHQNTDDFCMDTMCSILLLEYLREANWLLWGCDVKSCEGYRVSQALRENSYPFLAVAVLRGTRMTVIARFEGPIGPEELVNNLRNVVSENEMSLMAARAERSERSFTQTLRRQQDEAYEESLLADQLKEMKRKEQEEAERLVQEKIRQEQEARMRKKDEIARLKIDLADRIPPEPDNNPSAVHLVIKLPTGRRLERRFLPQHSLQDVYNYVFCHPESPDEFEIATNFPKRVLRCKKSDENNDSIQTLNEAGLQGKIALFVYDLTA